MTVAPKQTSPTRTKLPYQDDPFVRESFVDGFHSAVFDGHLMRLELTVSRFTDATKPGSISGQARTAVRLVIPPALAVDLYKQFARLIDVMATKGMVTKSTPQ